MNLSLKQGANPFDGGSAHLQVTFFDFGIESVPEILDQTAHEFETLSQAGDSFLHQESFRQPSRDLQVFCPFGKSFRGELDNL